MQGAELPERRQRLVDGEIHRGVWGRENAAAVAAAADEELEEYVCEVPAETEGGGRTDEADADAEAEVGGGRTDEAEMGGGSGDKDVGEPNVFA